MSYQSRKFLANVDLFANLPEGVLDDLAQLGVTLRTPPGESIVVQGAVDAGLQVLLEGSAEVTVNGVSRRQLAPGDYFGEISVIDHQPRSATVTSGPDGSTTFALSALAFAPVLAQNATVAQTLLEALCARLRAFDADATAAC